MGNVQTHKLGGLFSPLPPRPELPLAAHPPADFKQKHVPFTPHLQCSYLPTFPMTAVPWVINSLSDMPEKAASVRIFLAELTCKLKALLLDTACSPTSQPQPSSFLLLHEECHSNMRNCFHGQSSDQLGKWSPIKGRQNVCGIECSACVRTRACVWVCMHNRSPVSKTSTHFKEGLL